MSDYNLASSYTKMDVSKSLCKNLNYFHRRLIREINWNFEIF